MVFEATAQGPTRHKTSKPTFFSCPLVRWPAPGLTKNDRRVTRTWGTYHKGWDSRINALSLTIIFPLFPRMDVLAFSFSFYARLCVCECVCVSAEILCLVSFFFFLDFLLIEFLVFPFTAFYISILGRPPQFGSSSIPCTSFSITLCLHLLSCLDLCPYVVTVSG